MYTKFSDEELAEAYESMNDYSGKVEKSLMDEIEKRGGLAVFLKKIDAKKLKDQEIERISKEVYDFTRSEVNIQFIKDHIHSDILSQEELGELIESRFVSYSQHIADRSISGRTIPGSIAGSVLGILIGSIFLYLAIELLAQYFYILLIPTYIICYLSILMITKQSRRNIIVFLFAFLSSVISLVLGLYLRSVL